MSEPRLLRWLVARVARPADREVVLGDLAEEFQSVARAEGIAAARSWYRRQALRSLIPLLRVRWWSHVITPAARPAAFSLLLQEARAALRLSLRSPLVTTGVVLTIGLSVAASTAVLSIIGSVLLDPLPYPQSEQLVLVRNTAPNASRDWTSTSYPDMKDWRAQNRTFVDLASFSDDRVTLTGRGEARLVFALNVTDGFANVIGQAPLLGRFFHADEFRPGHNSVVVLSNDFWRSEFAGDARVLGQTLLLDNVPHQIVGVRAPAATEFPMHVAFWRPLAFAPDSWMAERRSSWVSTVGRVRPDVPLAAADGDLDAIAARLVREYPESNSTRPEVELIPLRDLMVGRARATLFMMLAAAGFVLLTACTSSAGLLLARSQQRTREFAVRASLGASRRRLAAQLLSESLVLTVTGGTLGLLLTPLLMRVLIAFFPGGLPRAGEVGLDLRALALSVACTALAGLCLGIAPARQAWRARIAHDLRISERAAGSRVQMRTRTLLVVVQVSLSVALLAGGGLLARSFYNLVRVETGFTQAQLLTFELALPAARYDSPEKVSLFYDALLRSVSALPGVERAATVNMVPFTRNRLTSGVALEGQPTDASAISYPNVRVASPTYLQTMQIPLLAGRSFTAQDDGNAPRVAIVNTRLAQRLLPGGDIVGKGVLINDALHTVVGVSAAIRHYDLRTEPQSEIYLPDTQNPRRARVIVLRVAGATENLMNPLQAAVQRLDSALPVSAVATMDDRISEYLAPDRYRALLLGTLALAGLILAVLGLYGVVVTLVGQRKREIGIRLALGEAPAQVRWRVLGWALGPALLGTVCGLGVALAGSRFLAGFLFGVSTRDPFALAGAPLLMIVVAGLAAWLPAWRASRIDPLRSLTAE